MRGKTEGGGREGVEDVLMVMICCWVNEKEKGIIGTRMGVR